MKVKEFIEWLKMQDQEATVEVLKEFSTDWSQYVTEEEFTGANYQYEILESPPSILIGGRE